MNACVCLVGWHYRQELIEKLHHAPGLELFILSHKPQQSLPDWLFKTIPERHVFFEKNLGYDWGAYQQFIAKGIWRDFDTIFFMHDDISLLDTSVFQACHEIVHSHAGKRVVGNGQNTTKRDWPRTHIHCYAHSIWKPPTWNFEHDTVRGSFFVLSRAALAQIAPFEVLWDRRKLYGVGAGNYSLRATCGKIQYLLGEEAFSFLSATYRQSSYLIEMERGKEWTPRSGSTPVHRISYAILVRLSRRLMTLYMNASPARKKGLADVMQAVFTLL